MQVQRQEEKLVLETLSSFLMQVLVLVLVLELAPVLELLFERKT